MVGRRVMVLVGAAALVAPLTGWTSMSASASNGSPSATPTAVPGSTCFSADNGDPVLKSFAVEPRAVDSRNGSKDVTFTATAEDTGGPGAASGVTKGRVFLGFDDSGDWNVTVELTPNDKGALVGTLTVLPQFRTATRYVSLSVGDAAGNSTLYSTHDLEGLGLPSTLSTTTNPDAARPALTSLRLSTSAVDTRRHSRSVTVTVRATDDAGVASVDVGLFGLPGRTPSAELELVAGSPQEGTWQGRLVVRRWQGRRTARLGVGVTDAVEKSRWYGPSRLAKKGLPSRLAVVSRTDWRSPSLTITSVSPASVDVTSTARTFQVVVRVRDAGSGARRVVARLDGPDAADGSASIEMRLSKASGTRGNGVWTGTVTLRPCDAPAGAWTALAIAKDAVRSSVVSYSGALTVVNADVLRPTAQVAGDAWRVRRTGPLTVEFDEDVVGVAAANAVVHVGDGQRGLSGADPAAIAGSWACKDAAGTPVDCTTGPVRTAAFTPTAPMNASTNHTLVINPEHQLGLTDLAGNPYSPHQALGFHTA